MNTTQARLMKLARANRDTFLYRHSGMTTQTVTTNTTPNRTSAIDVSHVGTKRINTFDSVSPTTTLYEIIAAKRKDEKKKMNEQNQVKNWMNAFIGIRCERNLAMRHPTRDYM